MAEVKALVSELLQLLVSDTDLTKLCKPVNGNRFNFNVGSAFNSGTSTPVHAPENSYSRLTKQDLWTHLDELLFPYMSYNLKVLMVPPSASAASATGRAVIKKQKQPSLLDAFVKANITSEAASAYSFDHLLPVAVYEACTKELLELAEVGGAQLSAEAHRILAHSVAAGNGIGLLGGGSGAATPIGSSEKRRKLAVYNLPGLGVINNNVDFDDDYSSHVQHLVHHHMTHVRVNFRRITRSRLQARCTVPALSPLAAAKRSSSGAATPTTMDIHTAFDFIWESSAINGRHNWKLRRFGFADSDDEEHYWRPWELTLEDAEADYDIFQQDDYKADLAPLDVSDIDWDSLTTSTTPTDDIDTLSSSTHSLTLHEPLSSLPAINNCDVPSKNNTRYNAALPNNGIFYQADADDSHSSTGSSTTSKRGKYLGKSIGSQANNFYTSALYHTGAERNTSNTRPVVLGGTHHHYNPVARGGPLGGAGAPGNNAGWGIDDHHNHYESMEIDYEDDYSYKQSHPVFQHPIASYEVYDDDDDIFGVCHSMVPAPAAKPAAPQKTTAPAPALVQQKSVPADVSTPTADAPAPAAYQQPANATATKTQPTPQPLLQRVCDGDDDDEAAYWDRYDDFV